MFLLLAAPGDGLTGVSVARRRTAGYHVGEEPDERSVETCRKHGVPINSLCRQLEVRRLPSLRRGGCR